MELIGPMHTMKMAMSSGAPLARFLEKIRIHAVPGNGNLREVVKQVLHEQLHRQHGQERQESAGDQHAEDITEVRAGGHLDIFDDVAKSAPALDDPALKHQQAFFQQDDVSSFFGHVHSGIDRNPNIGLPQSRGVIDAVPHETDGMAMGLQHTHNACFLHG